MTMEKQQETTLLKARSYRSVLAVAYDYYTETFRPMLKANWPYILASALIIPELLLWLMVARWLTHRPVSSLFRSAKKHWLLLIGVVIGGLIATTPLCLLVSLPLIILMAAYWESYSCMMMGDPQGMPTYMPWLVGIIWVVTACITACIRLFVVYVAYFAWGSAETRRRDRIQQKLNI